MPRAACLRTISPTAWRRRAWKAVSSMRSPRARERTRPSRSRGRGRLPAWVVRIRSVLRCMTSPLRSAGASLALLFRRDADVGDDFLPQRRFVAHEIGGLLRGAADRLARMIEKVPRGGGLREPPGEIAREPAGDRRRRF